MASTCVLCYIWNPVQVISNHRYHAYYTWTIGFTMHDFLQVLLTINLAVKSAQGGIPCSNTSHKDSCYLLHVISQCIV